MKPTNTFYIFLTILFIVGLENIDVPPFDAHDWRQTLTISMAKYFNGFHHLFYPPTIIGDGTDMMGSEFPIFNGFLAILYKIFGFQDWYGRLINWIISTIGLFYFYKLVTQLWSSKVALYSSIFLGSSIIFEYARKTMPDTISLFLGIAGSYYAICYLSDGKRRNIVFASLLLLLCGLIKLPFIITWVFILMIYLKKGIDLNRKVKLSLAMGTCLTLITSWYFLWVPHLLDQGASKLFFNFSITDGYNQFYALKTEGIINFFTNSFHFIPLTFLSIIGLGVLVTENKRTFIFAASYIGFFILLIVKSGMVFPTHDYYVMPIVPLLSIGAAYFIDYFFKFYIIALVLVLMLCINGFINNKNTSFNNTNSKYYEHLAAFLDTSIPRDAKLIVNGGEFNPTFMYWTGRKGWTWKNENFMKKSWVLSLRKKGLEYIVQNKHLLKDKIPFVIIDENEDFILYDIKEALPPKNNH